MTNPITTALELAHLIAAECLGEPIQTVKPLLGLGSVNQIFVVQTASAPFIMRMNDDTRALQDYSKERWCMAQATVQGIPGPQVLALGQRENFAYMLQTFVTGTHGADNTLDPLPIWRALGRYARRIHAISVLGYGEQLVDPSQGEFMAPPHPGFDGTWPSFITYNVESLNAHDPLLALGVFISDQRPIIRNSFSSLHEENFVFGLNHGDLSLKNTLVDGTGEVKLLDWGSAEVHITPHWEIIQMLDAQTAMNTPNDTSLRAFLDGYGLAPAEFARLQPVLSILRLLRAFDKLRWALDCSPAQIPTFAAVAQQLVRQHFAGTLIAGC